ncbi:DUF2252 domain-containing protein [Cupriavidus agavae]|uniref:Uncharacterized protein (DUF2252 family) n=1 Tax=Cupriavidus agavae TaxID=1001822 RepID=A0A4Q7SAJ5_9BURK|nr:DUF2252 domain-containing protein [Cupriavidus agavae]RZT42758.1 uncharacterized protein (DUF2252 family) [Cupriavidus agavae]
MENVAELQARRERGKALRQMVPRSTHGAIGHVDRDPIALLEQSSAGRVPRLVPLRYGRMVASPFAFYRGSAIIQAHDLAGTRRSGLIHQICGDCHLSNFGGFATPERSLLFDVNDFDETSPGPWEWDLKRLCASFVVAGRHLRHDAVENERMVREVVTSYRDRMAEYAEMSILETWYDRITFDRLLETAEDADLQKRVRRAMERAAQRTHETLLPKLGVCEGRDGRWRLLDAPPAIFHVRGEQTLFEPDDDWLAYDDPAAIVNRCFGDYTATLAQDRQQLLSHFRLHDTAFKVVGVGSVGTRCLILLMIDSHGKPLFLQAKEATKSVVARYFKSPAVAHEGRRVVEGQRLMQAASDVFLGWSKGPSGRHFYIRQLRDMKFSADLELMDVNVLAAYARTCGWVLARAHAKAGGMAAEASGYLGTSDRMADALVAYSIAYADQVERDYEVFVAACRSGRLEARTDADMAADFRV